MYLFIDCLFLIKLLTVLRSSKIKFSTWYIKHKHVGDVQERNYFISFGVKLLWDIEISFEYLKKKGNTFTGVQCSVEIAAIVKEISKD